MSTQETIQRAFKAVEAVQKRNFLAYELAVTLKKAPCTDTAAAFQTISEIIGWVDCDLADIMQDLDSVIEDRKAVHHAV